ncbi:MAG: hypothetical protein Q9163_006483, partial [Psora crenata]
GSKEERRLRKIDKGEKENISPGAWTEIRPEEAPEQQQQQQQMERHQQTGVFRDLIVYVNGSTAPLISDHKLKHLLAENGARISISLGRRSVTHVIVGKPNSAAGGAGGGLSGSKMQKEIQRVRGCGIQFVSVEWVLESLKAGKRLPERLYEGVGIAPHGVNSVVDMFDKQKLKRAETLGVGHGLQG